MLTLKSILILMVLHFVADQVLQLKSVQVTKNKSTGMMLAHVFTWLIFIYSFGAYAGYLTCNWNLIIAWPLTMAVIHFSVEWLLSRIYGMFADKSQIRMLLLLFFFENIIVMASMIILFNYFLNS